MRISSLVSPFFPIVVDALRQQQAKTPVVNACPLEIDDDPPPFADYGPSAPEVEHPGLLKRMWRYTATATGFVGSVVFKPLSFGAVDLSKVIAQASKIAPTSGNSLSLMVDGKEFRENLVQQIDSAQASIWINYYVFELTQNDAGGIVERALENARARGVRVRIITDNREGARSYVDASVHMNAAIDSLQAAGADIVRSDTKNLGINHRKIAVFDGQRAMVTGYNFTDNYMRDKPDNKNTYHDSGVLMSGPVVRDVAEVFGASWKAATGDDLPMPPRLSPRVGPFNDATVEMLRHDGQQDKNIESEVVYQIDHAQKTIRLANPNAITDKIKDALLRATDRQVSVEWLWGPQRTAYENVMSSNSVDELLPRVKVYSYPNMLHMKVFTFDDKVSIVGSSNLDSFSTWQDDEASLKITSPSFAREINRRIFTPDEALSPLLTRAPQVSTGSFLNDYLARGIEPILNRR